MMALLIDQPHWGSSWGPPSPTSAAPPGVATLSSSPLMGRLVMSISFYYGPIQLLHEPFHFGILYFHLTIRQLMISHPNFADDGMI